MINISRHLLLIVLIAVASTLAGCNSNEITQNVEVNVEQSVAGPQDPSSGDSINPLLILGGGMAIVIVGFLAMFGFSIYFQVPFQLVVLIVLALAILVIIFGLLAPALQEMVRLKIWT